MRAVVKQEGRRLLVLVRDPLPTCPKCGTTRLDRPACPRCGLASSRMDAYRQARDAAVADAVQRGWELVVARWSDARGHDDLLQLAIAHDATAWLAARYRERGDAIAHARLERLRRATEATLAVQAIARTGAAHASRPYRGLRIMLALLVVAAVTGWGYARVRGSAPSAPVTSR